MKVLIVDDSIFVREFIRKGLSDSIREINIILAGNGEEAYNLYMAAKPELIITDLLMPRVSGEELIKRIRKNDKATKIIVLSADIQKTVKDEINALGVTAFLNKPINHASISSIVGLIRE